MRLLKVGLQKVLNGLTMEEEDWELTGEFTLTVFMSLKEEMARTGVMGLIGEKQ